MNQIAKREETDLGAGRGSDEPAYKDHVGHRFEDLFRGYRSC